jgi:transmembrane sensor
MKNELIVKYIVGEADQQERSVVERWIAEDTNNREEFEKMKKIWDMGAGTEQVPDVDIDNAWSNFVRMRDGRKKHISWNRWAVAAAVLVFCMLGFWIMQASLGDQQTFKTEMQVQYATLPDGSTVHLNTHAEMSYEKGWLGKYRHVQLLKGEGFFDVKKDPEHPFVIQTGRSKITVLGTSFHVRREGVFTEVIVASGLVKVTHGKQEVVLKPNQMVLLADTSNKEIRIDTVPDQLYRYYVRQEFIFENTDLKRVFEVLGKAYGKQFVIDNPKTRELPYTATFEQQSLQEILEAILKTFDLKMEKKDNIYHIN